MNFDDERVRFYFRHREEIEQWAALRGEAATAVDEWLAQLAPDIAALAASLGATVRVHAIIGEDQDWPLFQLSDARWGFGELEGPHASIALQWWRGRTIMRGTSLPFVGVRSAKTSSVGVAMRTSDAFRQVRQSRKDATNAYWGSYKYIAPDGRFPETSEAYKESLVDALREAWRAYAELVGSAVATAAKSNPASLDGMP